jgi:hypothetical protein
MQQPYHSNEVNSSYYFDRFPLTIVPTYTATLGYAKQDELMYGVIASILAGAVAGDHASPISDTTILSAMASGCDVIQHVKTQGPYAVMIALWSILAGTLPCGKGVIPNWACIIIGFCAMIFHSAFTSAFVINKTGRFDIFTELFIRCTKDKTVYDKLRADVVTCFETGRPVALLDNEGLLVDTKTIDDEEGDTTSKTKKSTDDEADWNDPEKKVAEMDTEHSTDKLEEQVKDDVEPESMSLTSSRAKSSLIDSGALYASFMKHLNQDHAPIT